MDGSRPIRNPPFGLEDFRPERSPSFAERRQEAVDCLFLSAMSILEDILQARKKLDNLLQNAFSLLALSRYYVGSGRIGSAQLPGSGEIVTANTRIKSETSAETGCATFRLCTENGSNGHENEESTGPVFRGAKEEKGSDLRHEQPSTAPFKDPLNRFGVLVPQELKRAQELFKQATIMTIQIVNLQSTVNKLIADFWEMVDSAPLFLNEDQSESEE